MKIKGRKVLKAKGGADASKADFNTPSKNVGSDHSHSRFDASISRSLGGGASVYLDIRTLSGDTDTSGTDLGIGTSVSF